MMAPTLFKVGLLLLSQLHLTWAMILPRHPLISCTGGNPAVAGDTCASFASKWNLNETLFTSLNPDINCSNLVAGYYYCVVGWDLRAPTTTPTTAPTLIPRAPATSSLASNEPQESSRFAPGCIAFQLAQQHDDCTKFGIARDVFLALNPVINKDCTNLMAGLGYCTKKLDSSSSSSIDTSAKTTLATATAMAPMTTMTTVTKAAATSSETKATTTSTENKMTGTSTAPTPLRTHPGYPTNCKEHEHVVPSDTCVSIAVRKGVTPGDIMNLNEVGADCEKLYLDYDVCVRL